MVSLGRIPTDLITDSGRKALTSAVSLVPFLALVILRSCNPRPLFISLPNHPVCALHLINKCCPLIR